MSFHKIRNYNPNFISLKHSELERADGEHSLRRHHILERAAELKLEEDPEIKRLNEMIMQAKCHAIRDFQKEDRQNKLQQMAEADRAIEEQVS